MSYQPPFSNTISVKYIEFDEIKLLRGKYLADRFNSDLKLKLLKELLQEKNKSEESTETETIYKYNGVKAIEATYFLKHYDFAPITYIEITNDDCVLYFGVKVGMSKNELISILGPPEEISDNLIKYSSYHKNELIFDLINDKVYKIRFNLCL
ncbi:MAG: hypothetical protein ACYDEX_23215 [Mobilitalea sp.]